MSEKATDRKDPTCFLPEEPMVYEIKKKKKKKKRKHNHEDPFKGLDDVNPFATQVIIETSLEDDENHGTDTIFDPEVMVKVEDIEVDLDFNEVGKRNTISRSQMHSPYTFRIIVQVS